MRSNQKSKMPGLFRQLSPDQQKAAMAYRGDENHGDASFLEEREEGDIRVGALPKPGQSWYEREQAEKRTIGTKDGTKDQGAIDKNKKTC